MLVSGFILKFAPGSTTRPVFTAGYDVEVTNLADKDIQFDVTAHVTRRNFGFAGSPYMGESTLASLEHLIPAVMSDNYWDWLPAGWQQNVHGHALHTVLVVPAHSSHRYRIIPSEWDDRSWWPEAGGHIELTVPMLRSPNPPYAWFKQSSTPVPVLLNPSTIEVSDLHASVEYSYSRTSPPLATGTAYNEVPVETSLRIPLADFLGDVEVPSE